jgi:hypothetical protein
MRRSASEIIHNLEQRVARLERQASPDVQDIANEVIRAMNASYGNFKVKKDVECEIGGYQNASLIMHISVINSLELPESAKTLSLRDQKKVLKIVKGHLKFHESGSGGYHLLPKRATYICSLKAESIFEGDNKWTRQLMENPAVQLGYTGQLVQESSTTHNKLQEVNLTRDGMLEWVVTFITKWNCVLKRQYQ